MMRCGSPPHACTLSMWVSRCHRSATEAMLLQVRLKPSFPAEPNQCYRSQYPVWLGIREYRVLPGDTSSFDGVVDTSLSAVARACQNFQLSTITKDCPVRVFPCPRRMPGPHHQGKTGRRCTEIGIGQSERPEGKVLQGQTFRGLCVPSSAVCPCSNLSLQSRWDHLSSVLHLVQ